ncbi:C1q-like domain-containing protein [Paenibacillus sp. HJGM_3]|uniref:C1q-like domain-containing protein n=1 Tax=Paenibacillus sp. HJGM_3 TaxID=3379816 RepID=UPI00385C2320
MAQQTMFPGQVNSPVTELTAAIDSVVTTIGVLNAGMLPAAPNLAVIGSGEIAETIQYTGKVGNNLTGVTRGFQGTARAWSIGTKVARYFTAYDYDTLRGNVLDLDSRIKDQQILSVNLKRGMNYLSASQASPLNLTIGGQTLVNLLGRVGNCDDPSKFAASQGTATLDTTAFTTGTSGIRLTIVGAFTNMSTQFNLLNQLDTSKYYVMLADLKNGTATNVVFRFYNGSGNIGSTSHTPTTFATKYIRLQPSNFSTGQYIYFDINGADGQYGNIDSIRVYEITSAQYALIDVDPEWTGDRLASRFPYVDSVKHLNGASVTKYGKNLLPPFYEWKLHANAVVTEPYKLTLNATADFQSSTYRVPVMPSTTYTFSRSGTGSVNIWEFKSTGTNNGGSSAGSVYTITTKSDTFFLEVELTNIGAGTSIFVSPQLELGSTSTAFEPRNDDYVFAPVTLASSVDGTIKDSLTYRDGAWNKTKRWNQFTIDGSLTFIFSVDYTGFKAVGTSLSPVMAITTNMVGTRNDGMILPYGTGGSGTGPNVVSRSSGGDFAYFSVPDSETGWGEGYTPSGTEIKAYFYGWKMNNGTFGTPYDGTGTKTWTTWNATSNTGSVTVTPTTIATGYTPYTLTYQLAVTQTEVVSVEGAVSLHPGGNQIEIGEGVIVREKANPVLKPADNLYRINNSFSGYTGSELKNRTEKILAVYKNGVRDSKWFIFSDTPPYSNGKQSAQIAKSDFDTTAEYTVTYVALDKYSLTSTNTDTFGTYSGNIGTTVSALVADVTDEKTKNTIQDWELLQDDAYIKNLRFDVGVTSGLNTTAKILVPAVNEVNSNKVDSTRQIIAGAGLTGGGSLAADRTLAVSFGGNGSATTAAKSDHNHDTTYLKLAGGQTVAGTLGASGLITSSAGFVQGSTQMAQTRLNAGIMEYWDGSSWRLSSGSVQVHAFRSADQTISADVSTKLNYTGELVDTHNAYDAASSTFTVPVSGAYIFNFQVFTSAGTSTGNQLYIQLYKNGSQYRQLEWTNTGTMMYKRTFTVVVDAVVGEAFTINMINSGANATIQGSGSSNIYNNLSIVKL